MPSDLDTETRALLRRLLYGVIFESAPGEESAKRIIELVVDAPLGSSGSGPSPSRDKYRAAIRRALASAEPLTDLADNPRPDAVTRSLLASILQRLDATKLHFRLGSAPESGGSPASSVTPADIEAQRTAARGEAFAYVCNRCSLCCRDKVIQVNPYEVARLARRVGLSTGGFTERYTEDGVGTRLTRREDGTCSFLGPEGCSVHPDRPLVCRIYPLGRHVAADGAERWSHLAPHPQTKGIYGKDGTIGDYLARQDALAYMLATDEYAAWLRRAYDLVGEADDADTDGPSAADLLDMDGVIAEHCRRRGVEEPLEIEARKALHLMILSEWLDDIERGG